MLLPIFSQYHQNKEEKKKKKLQLKENPYLATYTP
jgi:hypothetical protein